MEGDDSHKPFPVTIRPAVPIDPNKVAQTMDLPSRKTVTPPKHPAGGYNIEGERLAEDEIIRLNTEREKNIERKKQMGRPPGSKNKPKVEASKRPKRDRHEPGEAAPESPTELLLFHDIILNLEGVSQEARKRIIAALGQVYP